MYMLIIVPFLFIFTTALVTSKNDTSDPRASAAACRDYILMDFAYFTVLLSNIPRAVMSCYMNLQFAKTREHANR